MKYYIIAGEASGDLHGSNLIKALKMCDLEAEVRCWGGTLMEEAGGILVKHYNEMAFMGFLEVLLNIGTILRNIRFCKKDIQDYDPDVIVFIDYSGFNLRIAQWAKPQGYRTNYYISPQVWASREKRVEKIKRDIDAMYVILPFEKEFYEQKHGFPVHFVGHPLLDALHDQQPADNTKFRIDNHLDKDKPLIALLPGSRKQEVKKMLHLMLSVIQEFPEYEFVIAGAPSLERDFYTPFLDNPNVGFVLNKTYELLSLSHAALVTSGTATLETALFEVPQVVCYRANWVSYEIAKRIITLKFISLVNLILDREVVKELIQKALNTSNLVTELSKILRGPGRLAQLEAYALMAERLGGSGASRRTAALIVEGLKKPSPAVDN